MNIYYYLVITEKAVLLLHREQRWWHYWTVLSCTKAMLSILQKTDLSHLAPTSLELQTLTTLPSQRLDPMITSTTARLVLAAFSRAFLQGWHFFGGKKSKHLDKSGNSKAVGMGERSLGEANSRLCFLELQVARPPQFCNRPLTL